ncbi:hypothetical protein BsWGS_10368 [Bradybaena similaris]
MFGQPVFNFHWEQCELFRVCKKYPHSRPSCWQKWVPGFTPWESEECLFTRGLNAEVTLTRRTELFWLGGRVHMGNRVQRHRFISLTFFTFTFHIKSTISGRSDSTVASMVTRKMALYYFFAFNHTLYSSECILCLLSFKYMMISPRCTGRGIEDL